MNKETATHIENYLVQYKPTTRESYRFGLKQFFDFCCKDYKDVTRLDIELYRQYLAEELKNKPRTYAGRTSIVRSFFRYLYVEGDIDKDPGANVKPVKIDPVSSTNGLTRTELANFLAIAQAESLRSYALLCLLGLNGLRLRECVNTNIEDLNIKNGYNVLKLNNRKGNKSGEVALSPKTYNAIKAYIGDRTSGPIFLGIDNKRISAKAIQRTVTRLARQLNIQKRISPHSFRHTFITLSLDAGVSERDIINSSGHADSRMIAYYDRNRASIERNATHVLTAFVGGI